MHVSPPGPLSTAKGKTYNDGNTVLHVLLSGATTLDDWANLSKQTGTVNSAVVSAIVTAVSVVCVM